MRFPQQRRNTEARKAAANDSATQSSAGSSAGRGQGQRNEFRVPDNQQMVHRVRRTGLAHIGTRNRLIARMKEPRLFTAAQLEQLKIVHPHYRNKKFIDVFRELRTILFSLRRNRNFTMMVTSIVPGGGSSFISLNLASAIAFDESKTSLLIDCNLREPFLHKLLHLARLDNGYGLTDYLEDPSIGIETIVRPSGIGRMRVVPVGERRESSSEYFTSMAMRKFINDVKRRYADRYLILDAPSLGWSADARIISDLCDYILLVVPYGKVTDAQVVSCVQQLDASKLVGVVLNDEPGIEFE